MFVIDVEEMQGQQAGPKGATPVRLEMLILSIRDLVEHDGSRTASRLYSFGPPIRTSQ